MVPDTPMPLMPTPPLRPAREVRSQILVLEGGNSTPLLINPEDEVTKGPQAFPVEYPDEVMRILTDPDKWLDVWQDGSTENGERTRLARRVFSRNVTNIVQAFIFPLEENMVQA